MAEAADKRRQGTRQEAIPTGVTFMGAVSLKWLTNAYKERLGKSQIILRACLLRKEE